MGRMTEVLRRVWDDVIGTQPAPDLQLVLICLGDRLRPGGMPGVWPRTRHVVTIAHEGAHAMAALASGRRLAGIRLHSDTSGLTVSRGRTTGPGMVVDRIGRLPRPVAVRPGWSAPAPRAACARRAVAGGDPAGADAGADPQLLRPVRRAAGAGLAVVAVSWWASRAGAGRHGVRRGLVPAAGSTASRGGAATASQTLALAHLGRRHVGPADPGAGDRLGRGCSCC